MTRVASKPPASASQFDVQRVRADFPILHQPVHGKPLVYLDNGATTQKPKAVIDTLHTYYASENANIHRAVHILSQTSTRLYEEARETVRRFINAKETAEIIFTRGTTEGINLVAHSLGLMSLKKGDEVMVSNMEHHSNIVPWQLACERTGATLVMIPMSDRGELELEQYEKLLSDRTKVISIVHVSNSLGTINPVEEIIRLARKKTQAKILLDGAQHVAHFPTDVQKLDCDFYAFSGHKLYGPTGIGVLYGRKELLEAMPPYQGGGDMIETVTFAKTTYAPLPNKFEAGTPNIAGVIGLGAAIEWVESVGFDAIMAHEFDLLEHATAKIGAIPGLRIIGTAARKAEIVSFVIDDPAISSYDLGIALDREGIAVRTGHHCCMPVMERLKVPSTTRASLAIYNTKEEIDKLVTTLQRIIADEKARRAMQKPKAPAPAGTPVQPLQFPPAAAATIHEAADALLTDFDLFDDPQGKNEYLEDLGEHLPEMPEPLKTESTRVHGCMSIVHMVARERPTATGLLEFIADSDASTVRGLIGMMQRLFSGQHAGDVLAFDLNGFLAKLGIDRIVTTRRRIGLDGLIKKIREEAQRIVAQVK